MTVREDAIYELSAALLAVREFDFPVRLNEVTEEYGGHAENALPQ